MVRLDVLVSAVGNLGGLDPDSVPADKTRIISFINSTRREIYTLPYNFSFLETHGELIGIGTVTAGTVKTLGNQAEITGTSTSWTTAMSGRYISVNSQPYQQVSYVSDGTHLTLLNTWQGTTGAADSYVLQKRIYSVPPIVSKLVSIKDLGNDRFLDEFDYTEFQQRFKNEELVGESQAYSVYGQERLGLSYLDSTVFTVTSTANSPILDFASSSDLVTAIAPGTRLNVGDSTTSTAFYVESIITSSRVSLNSRIAVSLAATSSTAQNIGQFHIRFHSNPEAGRILMYTGKKRLYDLFSNDDLIEDEWYTVIEKGAVSKCLEYINSPRYTQKIQEYQSAVSNLIRSTLKHDPYPRLKPMILRRYTNQEKLSKTI